MQNGNSNSSQQKPIRLSELSFAEIARMRREKTASTRAVAESRKEVESAIAAQSEPAEANQTEPAEAEPSQVVELKDNLDISASYFKVPNDIDKIAPLQDPKEYCAYMYLHRLSYGWGRNFCRVGYGALVKSTSLSSRSSAIRAMESLVEKRHIIRIEEGKQRRAGTLYRILSPEEILSDVFKLSIVKLSIVKLTISNSTMVKMSIVKMNTGYSQIEYSQNEYSEESGATSGSSSVVNMTIVKSRPNKNNIKDNLKTTTGEPDETTHDKATAKVLVVVSSSNCFRSLPESTIQNLCEKYGPEKVAEKINELNEQYAGKEMDNPGGLLTDALKKDYTPPKKVAKKRQAEKVREVQAKQEKVEKEFQRQAEEIRKRLTEEKSKLSSKRREELRNQALGAIKKTEGIKGQFITEALIEAKENEILKEEMEKN